MLHQDDRDPFVGQAAEKGQRLLRADGVQTGQRLVQQQNAGPHRQDTRQGHLLLLPAGEVEGLPVPQVGDAQIRQHFIHPGPDFGARESQILQSERHFVEDETAHNLPLRVLQEGADPAGRVGPYS
jgi:hypothetical protein